MDSALLIVIALTGIFFVAGIVLAVFGLRRSDHAGFGSARALGMSVGMLFGAALGTIVWQSTGEFVFWVIFMGGGMVTGLAIGAARATPRQR